MYDGEYDGWRHAITAIPATPTAPTAPKAAATTATGEEVDYTAAPAEIEFDKDEGGTPPLALYEHSAVATGIPGFESVGEEAVCVDFASGRIDVGRRYLAPFSGRFHYVEADLADVRWEGPLAGPFDAVVSAYAIHHVTGARRPESGRAPGLVTCGRIRLSRLLLEDAAACALWRLPPDRLVRLVFPMNHLLLPVGDVIKWMARRWPAFAGLVVPLLSATSALAHGEATGPQEFIQHNLVTVALATVLLVASLALAWVSYRGRIARTAEQDQTGVRASDEP